MSSAPAPACVGTGMLYLRFLLPPVVKPCPACGTAVHIEETHYYSRGRRGLISGVVVLADPHRGPCSRLCILSMPNDAGGVLHTVDDCPGCAAYRESET